VILLISVSWVGSITGMSYWHLVTWGLSEAFFSELNIKPLSFGRTNA
jgi:hypothetical protein